MTQSGQLNNQPGQAISNCTLVNLVAMGWIQVDDQVHVSGIVNVSGCGPGLVEFGIPTPIPTDWAAELGTGGTATDMYGNTGVFRPSGNSNQLHFQWNMNGTDTGYEVAFSGIYYISVNP